MKQATFVAEFQQLAKEKGYEVEDHIAIFNQDEAAAREFHVEASKGGFNVVLDFNQAGSYSGLDDLWGLGNSSGRSSPSSTNTSR